MSAFFEDMFVRIFQDFDVVRFQLPILFNPLAVELVECLFVLWLKLDNLNL